MSSSIEEMLKGRSVGDLMLLLVGLMIVFSMGFLTIGVVVWMIITPVGLLQMLLTMLFICVCFTMFAWAVIGSLGTIA